MRQSCAGEASELWLVVERIVLRLDICSERGMALSLGKLTMVEVRLAFSWYGDRIWSNE